MYILNLRNLKLCKDIFEGRKLQTFCSLFESSNHYIETLIVGSLGAGDSIERVNKDIKYIQIEIFKKHP